MEHRRVIALNPRTSGFVTHYNYGGSLARWRPSALWSFAVARFARLYPLYIFALILFLAFIGDPLSPGW
jgi:peptidoglycan/LPS O-acetylase OafA/YrhL